MSMRPSGHPFADPATTADPPGVVRVAMWSGPRNISTAMMRSFGARGDCAVLDEPLYAHYLAETGLDHPGREQILATQPRAWPDAVAGLFEPLPAGVRVQYQKHMAHHLLPGRPDGWTARLRHAFLIRDPARVIASYARVRSEPTLADLGFEQQARIHRRYAGPVVDADDLLADPPGVLSRLCAALDLDYRPAMLTWPAGRRDSDGVWAEHWYASVEASTGFAAPGPATSASAGGSGEGDGPGVPEHLRGVLEQARPYYEELAAHRIR
jgi:Sulfotransferase domain